MSRRAHTVTGTLRAMFDTLDAARSCAGAIQAKRKPPRDALRRLGIDEAAFDDMRLL